MNGQRRAGRLLALAVLLIGLTSGCTLLRNILTRNHANDFAEVNMKLSSDEARYTEQRRVVVDDSDTRRRGVFTDAQFREFQALEQNVIDANELVHNDVLEWAKTNTRPVSFDGHAKTLLDAQNKLIAFVKLSAVKP